MTIAFNTIPSDFLPPLFYAEMDNSQANTATDTEATLLIGQKLASGVAVANKPILVSSIKEASKQCGQGSMLARMFKAYQKSDPAAEIYILPVEEPAAGAVAHGTVTLTGTATEAGTFSAYIAGQRVQVGVASASTAAEVASDLATEINDTPELPVTAAAVAGVVTLTCRWKGATGNDILVSMNYRGLAGGEKTPAGISVAITAMSGGTAAPDLSEAVSYMGDETYDFIVHPFTDSASLDQIAEEMNDTAGRWSYLRMLYGHPYSALRGTFSDLVTFGDSRNNQHETIVGFEKTVPSAAWEYAASYGGRNAVYIKLDPARPTQTGALDAILPAPKEDRFLLTERNILLHHGIATSYTEGGVVRVERAITTYQENAWGQADNSYLDSETLHTSAYVIRRLKRAVVSKYGRHKLADDGTNFAEGTAIVTPSIARGEIVSEYRKMELEGIVENTELFKKALIVERPADSSTRLSARIAPDYVNQLRTFAVLNQFLLQNAA